MDGKELKLLRIKNDKKAIDISKAAGISASKLSMIEKNHIPCSIELYKKILNLIYM